MKRKSRLPNRSAPAPAETALERFRGLLDADEYNRLLAGLEQPLYPALRLNRLKVELDGIHALASRYGWEVEGAPFCPAGWRIKNAVTPPGRTIEHRLGSFYIQDVASMLPVELFDFDADESSLTLDMAASPGGKTTHLVDKTGDRALVIANDSSKGRITALRLVLQTWGAASSVMTCFPGERFGDWFPETFDRILLDAPCSMQGLRAIESHPMRPVTDRERDFLALRQFRLLESAFRSLKVGGQVVYSTCTLTPEENEGVLDTLLQTFPGAVQVKDLSGHLPAPAPALKVAGERRFTPGVEKAARLWPHLFGTVGFFAALLVKTAPSAGSPAPPPERSWERTGFIPLADTQRDLLYAGLRDGYGFDLPQVLEDQRLILWRRSSDVVALPERLYRQFGKLPFHSAGLAVGRFLPINRPNLAGFEISHEWAARYHQKCLSGRYLLPDEFLDAWIRGEDLRGLSAGAGQTGQVVLVVDRTGRFLGRGRFTTDRLKNLLPRRVAI